MNNTTPKCYQCTQAAPDPYLHVGGYNLDQPHAFAILVFVFLAIGLGLYSMSRHTTDKWWENKKR